MIPAGTPASSMRGVWSRNAEGRQDSHESEGERRGNRRRGTRRMGAATAIEWRAVRPEPQAGSAQHAAGGDGGADRTGAGTTARRGAEAGVRRSRHRRRTECRGEPRRCPLPAQPARASEARSPTSAARSAAARSERRSGGRCCRTWQRARRPGSGGERSEPPGKRSAQRPQGAEARGIAVEIGASAASGDWNGKPGREATRPDSPYHSAHRPASSPPSTASPSAPSSPSSPPASGASPPAPPPPRAPALSAATCRVAGGERRSRRGARRRRRRATRRRTRGGGVAVASDQKGERAAPVNDAARDALRPMRCSAGPGCRAAAHGPRGCR